MQGFLLKGLVASLVAGAALTVASPSFAAPVHRDRVIVREHLGGRPHAMVRYHRFAPGHFNRMTVVDRERWRGGHWWHGARHGRIGWWWYTGGLWYWYPQAVYPYPTYVSTDASYDYAPQGYSENSWYYCEDPQGYYPYVRSCSTEWRAVPISPQARAEANYGEPPTSGYNEDSGYSDDGNYDDDSYSDEDMDNDNDEDDSPDNY